MNLYKEFHVRVGTGTYQKHHSTDKSADTDNLQMSKHNLLDISGGPL